MVSDRIGKLRKAAGMNQYQLAEKLNVSASAIGMYERGYRSPSIDMLVAMAQLFDVSLDFLITGSEYVSRKEGHQKSRNPDTCPCTTCFWKQYLDA